MAKVESLPATRFSQRSYDSILAGLSQYILNTYPNVWSDFFQDNIGLALLQAVAYTGDILSYAIDRTGEEMNILTVQQRQNILKLVSLIGYRPRLSSPSEVTVEVTALPSQLANFPLTIKKGTQISASGVTFETQKDFTYPAGSTRVEVSLVAGESQTDDFIGPGTSDFTMETTQGGVIEDSWVVAVDGAEWLEVDYIETQTTPAQVYSVSADADAKVTIHFGNGTNGAIPAAGSRITLDYRIGGGANGNMPAHTIKTAIIGYFGSEAVSMPVENYFAAQGGLEQETVDHIRKWAPATVRTMDKAITADDYATLSSHFGSKNGSIARAVARIRHGTLLVPNPGPSEFLPVNSYEVTTVQTDAESLGNKTGATRSQVAIKVYVPGASSITRILFYGYAQGNVGTIRADLMTDAGGFPSTTPVSENNSARVQDAAFSHDPTAPDWVPVEFPISSFIQPGTYWLVLTISSGSDTGRYVSIAGSTDTSSTAGYAIYNGTNWIAGAEIASAAYRVESGRIGYQTKMSYETTDANTALTNLGMNGGVFSPRQAMSVTVAEDIKASQIQVYLRRTGIPNDILISVETDDGGHPSGSPVGGLYARLNMESVYGAGWVAAPFSPAVNIVPGNYWIVLYLEDTDKSVSPTLPETRWIASTGKPGTWYYNWPADPITAEPIGVRQGNVPLAKNASLPQKSYWWGSADDATGDTLYVRLDGDVNPNLLRDNSLRIWQFAGNGNFYQVYGGTEVTAGQSYAIQDMTGLWTPGSEIASMAFRIAEGGPHTVEAGAQVLIDGIEYRTYSEVKLDGRNMAIFLDPNTVDVFVFSEGRDSQGRRTFISASPALRESLGEYLSERSVVTVLPVVQNGQVVPLDLDLGDIRVDPRLSLVDMTAAVNQEIEDFFMLESNQPGATFHISDLYQAIEEVPGVLDFVLLSHQYDVPMDFNQIPVAGNVTFRCVHPTKVNFQDVEANY